ncbi:acetylglutamate kinase [Bacillus tianshenii]|nr:acetylglutamate kinase [Bacillus tianshenii]
MKETVVIKCGGSTMAELSDSFFQSIAELKASGKQVVIVHGGGPEIKKALDQLQVESTFVNGYRKTTADVLDAVIMVLGGKVNKQLVSNLQNAGLEGFGCCGVDGSLLQVKPKDVEALGFVGEIVNVNTELLDKMVGMDIIPVIAPLGIDENGQIYNINADSAAGAVAKALNAKQLLFVTDVDGILKDEQLLESLTAKQVQDLIEEGTIYGGMIPKVEAAIHSLTGTLEEVMIINGKGANVVQNGKIIGTKITRAVEVV